MSTPRAEPPSSRLSPSCAVLPMAQLRVQVARVHDAECPVGTGRRSPRTGLVEAIRDRDHDLVGQLGKLGAQPPRSLRRAHDYRGSVPRTRPSAVARAGGGARSGRSSSRRGPTDRRGPRPMACRSPRRSPPPLRPRRKAASRRRRGRHPLRGPPRIPSSSIRRSTSASRGPATAASARSGAASRCSPPAPDRAPAGRPCSPARPSASVSSVGVHRSSAGPGAVTTTGS